MGKISTRDSKDKARHDPLFKDISSQGGNLRAVARGAKEPKSKAAQLQKDKRSGVNNYDDDDEGETVLDAAASRRVLQLAKEQQEEIAAEENLIEHVTKPRFAVVREDSDDDEDYGEEEVVFQEMSDGEKEYYEDEDEEIEEVDADDLELFESYFKTSSDPFSSFNLADKILDKINEKKMETEAVEEKVERPQDKVFLPPRVIEAYEKVGQSLSSWRSGKLPKLFKVLPTIKNWEDLIFVTNPEAWTPQIVFEATKLFVSNLTASKAEKFVNLVLLPRFRLDIEESEDHKLNYHIYRSLKKALYKPSAFFKGFLFPLVEEECTGREAMIVGSILTKCSVPVQHSSVALSWLLEREFNPASTVFIRILVEKKYALPYQTIDDLVFYFMRFRVITDAKSIEDDILMDDENDYRNKKKKVDAPPMPLVWHKAFLAFAQRYKNDITDDQRDFLMEVLRQRGHREIGPEIRRELQAGKERAGAMEEPSKKDDIMAYL